MRLDPIGREEAQELARRELEKPIYHRDDPSWLERTLDRIGEWLNELFNNDLGVNPSGDGGGWASLLIVLLLVSAAIALVAWVMRGRRNTRSQRDALLEETPTTAKDHRTAAEEFAAAGDWPNAIRERLRALARDLEERAVLSPRPGRTADELADEAGEALPPLATALRDGVRTFDDVWYGDRPGSAAAYARMKDLDDKVRKARPRQLDADTGTGTGTGTGTDDGTGQDGGEEIMAGTAEEGGIRW